MPNAARASLIIDAAAWRGWEDISITRGIERIAGTFQLTLTDRWPGQTTRRPLAPGAPCRVELYGRPVITGHIDDVEEAIEETSRTFTVRGRDRAGDLVDCSAVHKSGGWKNARLEDIAADICAPFKIKVTAPAGTGARFETFRIQEGETAFEAIERACRQRARLVRSDGVGGIVIAAVAGAANPNGALKLGAGGNVLKLRATASLTERFSTYTVKGQDTGGGWKDATDIAGASATAADGAVTRYRPLIVIAEEPGNGPTFAERAAWESRVRAARAKRITVTVQGWRDAAGAPWRPGDRVGVDFPRLKGEMLIAQITHTLGAGGTLSDIDLVLPGAFDVLPKPTDTTNAGGAGAGGAGW
ncbi:phage baseplate assembly protein [Varunaivibrio sulfuroxidans]|uniref:Prophage tail gpP-like protein n=1 Tax=Varunaivibrio sulfuroxidans TaxID=1773489 RepID=A0A4R3JAE1_9PROT|nr:hypothetical protein [Varunaivibrio sulfuroxidans]TCS62592.1 prophage tail gpP-like protein [Varunaivibrio sulfuroxidans]WES30739.1 hypothetical protein P3M64_14080 [Varunaivibrio sulfuroxidans]